MKLNKWQALFASYPGKTLKAHVCQASNDLATPVHNLLRLTDKTLFSLTLKRRNLLAEVNSFNIEGCYPELFLPLPSQSEADVYIKEIGDMLKCLNNLF